MALQLNQRTGIASRLSISLRENAQLEIEKRNGLSTTRQELPLISMSPDAVHLRTFPGRWIGGTIVAALLVLLSLIAAYADSAISHAAYWASVVFTLAGFICAYKGYRAHQGKYTYHQATTGTDVISIRATSEGRRFVEALSDTIKDLRNIELLSSVRRSEQHKKHMEFLLGEGVLTPNEFSSIMSRMERKLSLARLASLRT